MRNATGAPADDPRLSAVRLDLTDAESIKQCACEIEKTIGAPHAIVHNAGVAAVGFVEETPTDAWEHIFSTNLFGPVALTKALLPGMRAAGRGRVVMVSSQSGIWGMPSTSAYSAVKAGVERWAEALAGEISPFGLGVTVLVAGAFDTDIINDRAPDYPDYRDWEGTYALQHPPLDKRGHLALRIAKAPAVFAQALAKSLDRDRAPFVRRGVGPDARMVMLSGRILPARVLYQMVRLVMGQPRHGSLKR
jgi:NAD(P)-dependent dehydrogenase (short-subunit alcohol dehydrogenase family)